MINKHTSSIQPRSWPPMASRRVRLRSDSKDDIIIISIIDITINTIIVIVIIIIIIIIMVVILIIIIIMMFDSARILEPPLFSVPHSL